MKVQPSIRRVQNQESQEGPPTCDQKPPQPQKRWRTNRHRKRVTNHEGQPRPPSQPTLLRHLSQKHTHSKLMKKAAGEPHLQTKQTTPQLEHPDTGCKTPTTPASKRSKRSPEKEGKGWSPTHVTKEAKDRPRWPENPKGTRSRENSARCRPWGRGRSKTPPTQP